ncbi:MAG: OprO/OprP family phosphate-selective porin [candidate division KSB1 bacterium]|nr:OprO/OprP family phosphate-selective porin [candidate division KSB1 bacterium]MDZ7301189.1 OprO/OprP family phosphate-selective porin [candidate division KSB1 bacterium]MDZ7310587.1 OprO/OprP family phosphate-selective porin [candidate division KSB1 bacterium]
MKAFQPIMAVMALLLVVGFSPSGVAQDTTSTVLAQRLEALDQKVRILERRWEIEQENAAARAKQTPIFSAGKDGFLLKSADEKYRLKLRGYLQTDGRFFAVDQAERNINTFWLRRIRPIFEGTLDKYFDFYLMPDFGEGRTVLQDAYIDFHYCPWARLRIGKFKEPFGLERLQSGANLMFIERALPNNLVPNRDVGVQLHGELLKGTLTYAGGIFNGVADGGSADNDPNDAKDVAGRIFIHPFKNTVVEYLQGLGLGLAGSTGNQQGSASSPNLPIFKTPAQQSFFSYRSDGSVAGTTFADGRRTRISPQAYYYWGSFSLLSEYVFSSQEVTKGSSSTKLLNEAWQVAATYGLTGQKTSYRGVEQTRSFEPKDDNWGAFELAARFSKLEVDKDAFPVFADIARVAQEAKAWAIGLNWYLDKNVKLILNFEQADFIGGANQGNRESEKAIMGRVQISY